MARLWTYFLVSCMTIGLAHQPAQAADDDWYHHHGPLAGSLKSDSPLPLYDADPQHLWNRLFAAFYIRTSNLPHEPGGPPVKRIEGGDYIDFFGWGATQYWSEEPTTTRLDALLDEFIDNDGARMIDDPLKRAVMLRDLWAPYDFLIDQNIRRFGPKDARDRRHEVCRKLATILQSLALPKGQIARLPDNYACAVDSGRFDREQDAETDADYLPPGLFTAPDEWIEIDFFQPDLHEDLYDRFLTLHSKEYLGRSYFRIFYRYPNGRTALKEYLRKLEEHSIDWRQAAQDGFILLKKDASQIPVGTEVALVQFMMTLDQDLKPTPTRIVESLRHRTFRNVDGSSTPSTNTGVGMHVSEYTLKRRLLFDKLKHGGLEREPDDVPQYRIIFQPADARDWGTRGRQVLFQQCADCHMTPNATRPGVHSMPSIVHMGGFNAGAQLGTAHPLPASKRGVHAQRTARWKTQHETYRRLLEYLDR